MENDINRVVNVLNNQWSQALAQSNTQLALLANKNEQLKAKIKEFEKKISEGKNKK